MNNSVSEPLDDSNAIGEWQRLSPLSVIFFIGKLLSKVVKDMLPSLAPLGIVVFNSDNKSLVFMLVLISGAGLILLSSFLQYWFFKFKQEGDKVLINDGVFKKNKRVITFDRIQNINILQPIYFKFFKLVTLQIQTAGAKGNEADLAGIPITLANGLRNIILERKSLNLKNRLDTEQIENGFVDESPPENTEIFANASITDLIKYGVSSNGVFWFFIILAPLIGMLDDILEKVFTKEDIQVFIEMLGGGFSGKLLAFFLSVLMVIILMFVFSILGAIFRYYRYQLVQTKSYSENKNGELVTDISLKRSSGLLTSYEESLKLNKIQSFIVKTNVIGKMLSVAHITLGQVSSGKNNQTQKQSLFVVPARTIKETKQLLKNIFTDTPDEIETTGISKRYMNKTVMLKLFLPCLLLCLPVIAFEKIYWLSIVPFAVSALLFPLVYLRWRAYRYGMNSGYAKLERGLFGYRHVVFPLYKVQRAEVRQSPIQKRKNLATLKIYLASNQLQMQYIPYDVANEWLEKINQAIHNDKRAWY